MLIDKKQTKNNLAFSDLNKLINIKYKEIVPNTPILIKKEAIVDSGILSLMFNNIALLVPYPKSLKIKNFQNLHYLV